MRRAHASASRTAIGGLAGLLILCFTALAPLAAHEVAGEVRVHAFVKPDGNHLRVLLRVPLALLPSLDLPRRRDGFLDLSKAEERFPAAIAATARSLPLFEDGRVLTPARGAARIALPSDTAFATFDEALASVRGSRLPDSTDVVANQGYLDLYLEYPIRSQDAAFALDFQLSPVLRDRLKLDLRYLTPAGTVSAFDIPTASGRVELDPRWFQAAWSFVQAGFVHILDGADHLLFLLCLVIPFRRIGWTLVGVITSFTLAHSITLIAAAYGFVPGGAWFPPLIETLIAASILYMAVENVVRPNLERRWLLTFLFGLVHGFGFSFLLRSQLQFAGSHLLTSLLAFNVGIELGQLLVLAIVLPVLLLIVDRGPVSERALTWMLSVSIGLIAWYWMTARALALLKIEGPPLAAWSIAAIGLAAVALIFVVIRTRARRRSPATLTSR